MSSNWSENLSITELMQRLTDLGCETVYVKYLAPNDNSKNQVFVGNDLSEVSFFPMGPIEIVPGTSKKRSKNSSIAHLWIDAEWLTFEGTEAAPTAQLIYYPQYPEVRFSGFLKGTSSAPNELLNPLKRGREVGRILLCGINPATRKTYLFLVSAHSASAVAIRSIVGTERHGVFSIWDLSPTLAGSSRTTLFGELCRIHRTGWIRSKRLTPKGVIAYTAQNGGGYTLEAELGVMPNGYAAPDFLGWEVKQHAVKRLSLRPSGSVTLFTPEPDGGVYMTAGLKSFITKWGKLKRSAGRWNFTGRHIVNSRSKTTNLTLKVVGFSAGSTQFDVNGAIQLVDKNGVVAASWSFQKLLEHWKRKHSNAVYVPSVVRVVSASRQYSFGSTVHLGIGTSFILFLEALVQGIVFYDPGIHYTLGGKSKKRNQFRVNYRNLSALYVDFEYVDVCSASTGGNAG
jgi:hypothetical protein